MNDRLSRVAFLLLFVNTLLVLLGVLALAWQAKSHASVPLAPTDLALFTVRP